MISKNIQMKNILNYIVFAFAVTMVFSSCNKDGNYPGGEISPYYGIYDLRNLYKGSAVELNTESLEGSNMLTGVVTSDHREGNLPAGLLTMQDRRRLNKLRGIAINLGDAAKNYLPGDSIVVNVVGGKLERVNGILQISGLDNSKINKVAEGVNIPLNRVNINAILNKPDQYESTLVAIVKGIFTPVPSPEATLAGDKIINDGFGDITLKTQANTSFSTMHPPGMANYYGIIFSEQAADGTLKPYEAVRSAADIVVLGSDKEETPVVISGFVSDAKGGDGNYEYIQFLATQDIDFSVTPYAVVVTNNAGASQPTGFPEKGWATGNQRTYKLNLTKGIAKKGTFFYVGGIYKLINGSASTDISAANWILNYDYVNKNGYDFGNKTGGLLANSGFASGIAIFKGTTVTEATYPVDVMFVIGSGGSLNGNGRGYRIANSDYYDKINPIDLKPQPFYLSGSNTLGLQYNTADLGYFVMLGGEYNTRLGRWTKARSQNNILMTKQSLLSEIETELSTKLVE